MGYDGAIVVSAPPFLELAVWFEMDVKVFFAGVYRL